MKPASSPDASIPSHPPGADSAGAPLKMRRVSIDTYRENVAYLHRDCEVYRAEGFQALSKVEVRANGRMVLATLNVTSDPRIVQCHEIGLSQDAFSQLGVEPGFPATISQAEPPASMAALHRKIDGERLSREDFIAIVRDIAEHRYSKIELSAFVVATNRGELDREEVYFLTEAMIECGRASTGTSAWWWTSTALAAYRATALPCWWCPSSRRMAWCVPRRPRAPSLRRRVRPTPWRCWPTSNCHSSA